MIAHCFFIEAGFSEGLGWGCVALCAEQLNLSDALREGRTGIQQKKQF